MIYTKISIHNRRISSTAWFHNFHIFLAFLVPIECEHKKPLWIIVMEKLLDDVESYVFNEFARIILMQHLKTLVNVIQIYEFSQKTLLTQKNQNFAFY